MKSCNNDNTDICVFNTNNYIICSTCLKEKYISDFYKRKDNNSIRKQCKQCHNAVKQKYKQNNKLIISVKNKNYRLNKLKNDPNYLEKERQSSRKYKNKNKELIKLRSKSEKYKKKKRQWFKSKINSDINFKLRVILRNRFKQAILKKYKNSSAITLIGCSIEHLKIYIESKFKPGMNWDNYGRPNGDFFAGWHIDHIKPCVSFDLTDFEQQKECFHYTNLQPLWAEENLKKGCITQDEILI